MMARQISKTALFSFLLILVTSALSAPASAQESDQALIVGNVSSGGLPIEGLEVIVNMAMGETYVPIFNVTTNSEGMFEVFEDLFGNSFLLEFQYGGLLHLDAFVSVNETYTVDFDLSGGLDFVVLGLDGRGVEGIHVNLLNKIGYAVGHILSNSSGSGIFDGLNVGDPFMITFDYKGVPYSEIIDLVNSTSASVELHLLETTTSDESIEASMHHVVVEMEGEYLSVWEGVTFRNLGDQIFNNSWLKIWLPPEAEEVDSDVMDCCVQNTDEGILVDPMDPIFPAGTFETKVEYKIKAKSSNQVLAKRMDYDTPSFLYLIENVPGITIENPVGLTYDSERNLAGTDYIIYRGSDLTAGETVSVQFKGLVSWTDALMRNPLVWAGGLLLAPVALLVYFFILKKDNSSVEPESAKLTSISDVSKDLRPDEEESPSEDDISIEDLEAERTALRSVLDKIEDDHRNRVIDNETYRTLKTKYGENLEKIDVKLKSSKQVEELEDLRAEEIAIRSILAKIALDHEKSLLSERAFNRLKERYQERLTEIRTMLEKSE
jgi:hypothetical protein